MIAFFVLVLIISTQAIEYSADFRLTNRPGLSGILTGRLYYSTTAQRTRWSYSSNTNPSTPGFEEIISYNTNQQEFFTFRKCGSKCDTIGNAAGLTQPLFERLNSDTAGNTMTIGGTQCTRYNRNSDPRTVRTVCATASGTVLYIELTDNTEITLSNHGSVPSGALTANTGWGCIFSCDAQADITLVVDESGSIGGYYDPNRNPKYGGEWANVATFVQKFTQQFKIGPNKIHMGLVKFAAGQTKVTAAMTSDSTYFNNLVNGLSRCSGCSGATYIGNGVIWGVDLLKGNVAYRNNVAKIVVLVTDGYDNNGNTFSLTSTSSPIRSWINDISSTASNAWANWAKNTQGVKIIAIGVGSGFDATYLRNLASVGPNGPLSFSASTFDYLSSSAFIESLGTVVCTASGTQNSCPGCAGLCACGVCQCPDTCDDSNRCTRDTCTSGSYGSGCVYRDISSECDDNNKCTDNSCNPSTGCVYTPFNAEQRCNDNNPCTNDTCVSSLGCQNTPRSCVNPNPCLVGSVCQTSNGQCTAPNDICNDQNPCTFQNCTTPPCQFYPIDCTQGNKCIVPDCNRNSPNINGCTNQTVNCSDGNLCTEDTCDPATGCVHTPIVCNDNNACTDDTCDPRIGCVFTRFNVTERCNQGDVCSNYTCEPTSGCTSSPLVCPNPYNDSCILVECDPYQQCIPVPKKCNYTKEKPECYVGYCDSTKPDSENCYFEETQECALTIVAVTTGAVLGIGAIVGIIIAAVVCAAGTTTLAVLGFNGAFSGEFENKNPLYEKETKEGKNPLYKRNSKAPIQT